MLMQGKVEEVRGLCDCEAGQHQASTQRRPRTALKVRPVRSGIDIAFHAENVMPCSPGIMTHACMHAWHSTALPPRVPLPPDPERVAVCNATAQRPVDEGADEVEHDDGEGELLEETVSPGPSRSLGLRLICHFLERKWNISGKTCFQFAASPNPRNCNPRAKPLTTAQKLCT